MRMDGIILEMKMNYNELTGDYVLEIIDFAYPDETDDMRTLGVAGG